MEGKVNSEGMGDTECRENRKGRGNRDLLYLK